MKSKKFLFTRYPLPATRYPKESGQATLEFAIFFPLFALVIAMIIQFSWLLLAKQRVEMAAFRGALYAAKSENIGDSEAYIRENVVKKFFPEQQQGSLRIEDFLREPGPSNQGIDYAELCVCADVHILGMFTLAPFRQMWQGIAGASKTRARAVADRIQDEVLNPDPGTIRKIRGCHDEYSGGTYTVCAFHKIAYDPDVPFSKE